MQCFRISFVSRDDNKPSTPADLIRGSAIVRRETPGFSKSEARDNPQVRQGERHPEVSNGGEREEG